MKKTFVFTFLIIIVLLLNSCSNSKKIEKESLNMGFPELTSTTQKEDFFVPETTPEIISEEVLNYSDTKAVWISYIELAPLLALEKAEDFETEFKRICINSKEAGFNTLFVQVRAFGDAFYPSLVYPKSRYLSADANYDPLLIMINTSHLLELSFHAWINTFRLETDFYIDTVSENFKTGYWYQNQLTTPLKDAFILKSGDRWYLNPANPKCQELIAQGVRELAENYNIDGINIDDYFYPEPNFSFDKEYFETHSNGESQKGFRLRATTETILKIRSTLKEVNENILFGICPAGNIELNYESLFADVLVWASSYEYCDYIAPQIYFGFENETQPFEQCLSQWKEATKVKLIPGLAAYKNGKEDLFAGSGKEEWILDKDVLYRQKLRSEETCSGYAIFSYNWIFES